MTALLAELKAMIAEDGPMSIERYMALALGHPRYGYYMTRVPFGAAGDFTTAPEISQMFGELIGLWAATLWDMMGRPDPMRLVELGPGRGTLMADALRATGAVPGFRTAVDLHFVETSPALRVMQEQTLAASGVRPHWHDHVGSLPEGPALIIANEFFDALPIRQFVRMPNGLHERLVGLGPDGNLSFGLAPEPSARLPPSSSGREKGLPIFEVAAVGQAVMREIAVRLVQYGGALVVIDYGHLASGPADTLQAMKQHRFVDPLADPGEADLTAHVDFAALAEIARAAGAAVHGPVTQGAFLSALGLSQRAAALTRRATPAQAEAIAQAATRLAGPDPGMGQLFKVMGVSTPNLPPLPGLHFETQTS